MERPKKDGVHINYYIDREVKEMLDKYCKEVGQTVYDLLNCLILDYTNCPKTAQFYAQNGSLISPEYSGDITLSNYFVKFF